jgi:hypothetical protein
LDGTAGTYKGGDEGFVRKVCTENGGFVDNYKCCNLMATRKRLLLSEKAE